MREMILFGLSQSLSRPHYRVELREIKCCHFEMQHFGKEMLRLETQMILVRNIYYS